MLLRKSNLQLRQPLLPHRGIIHVCVLQVSGEEEPCPRSSCVSCLLNLLILGAAEGSCCCKECAVLSVPSLQTLFLIVSVMLIVLWSSSKCPAGSVPPWELCGLAQCVLHVHAGWHSRPSLGRVFTLLLQTEPGRTHRVLFLWAAKGMRASEKCWWHRSLQGFLKPGHLWNQAFWCFRWGAYWCWFIYFTIRQSSLITSLSWGHEWEAARHGERFSAVGALWCCVGITICTEASLWYKPHPLLFLIRSSLKYNIFLVGETKEDILLGYSIKVPSIMLLC